MPQANYCGHGRTAFENERISRTTSFSPFLNTSNEFEQTAEAGGSGDGGDKYTGLDRFGRLVLTLWKKGTNPDLVRTRYGRNRFGGVVWRRDDRAHAQTPTAVTTEDNYYLYDGTNQIKERKRGNLAGTPPNYTGIAPIQQQENWTYDASGNWTQYSNPSTAAGHTQDREHNDGNELWKISVSGLGEVWPIYDSMGNMRTLPKAPGVSTDQYTLKWDAWNRLVEVKDGSTVVASYTYDGLNRRLTKTAGSETRHYYYDTQWRPLEERVGSSTTPDRQYTWGLRDRWDLLRRKRSTTSPLDETLYVLRDYLDPVAIADAAGNVVERYAYDAFGEVRFLDQNYGSRPNSSYAWDLLFHGEFRDPETKLYNYGHRYYDAGLGRWLSRDPIGEEGGVNLYAFVQNYPIDRRDSLGLWWWDGDYIEYGVGGLLGLKGPPGTASAAWRGAEEGYAKGAQGIVNVITGGFFDSRNGLFHDYFNELDEGVYGSGIKNDSAFETGSTGGRVAAVAAVAAVAVWGWAAAGLSTMSVSGSYGGSTSFHAFWAITVRGKTTWMHASRIIAGGPIISRAARGLQTLVTRSNTISGIPVIFPKAATALGVPSGDCVLGVCSAFIRAWGLYSFLRITAGTPNVPSTLLSEEYK